MKYLLIGLVLLFVVLSCSKKLYPSTDEVQGTWTMISFVAFLPSLPEFEQGDILWEFNSKKKTLTVVHKYPDKVDFSLKMGTYGYSIDNKKVIIDGKRYLLSFRDDVLILNSNTDPMLSHDGPVIQFKKVE